MNRNGNCCGDYTPRNNYDKCYEQRCPEFEVNCPYNKNNSQWQGGCHQHKDCGCNERYHKQCCGLCDCMENFFRCLIC